MGEKLKVAISAKIWSSVSNKLSKIYYCVSQRAIWKSEKQRANVDTVLRLDTRVLVALLNVSSDKSKNTSHWFNFFFTGTPYVRVHCATQRENHVSSVRSQSTWTLEQTERFKVHHTGTLGGYKGKHAHYPLRKCPSANIGAIEGRVSMYGSMQIPTHCTHWSTSEWEEPNTGGWVTTASVSQQDLRSVPPYLKRSAYVLPVCAQVSLMLWISYTTPKHAQKTNSLTRCSWPWTNLKMSS